MQKEILTPSNCKKDLSPQTEAGLNPFLTIGLVMIFLMFGSIGLLVLNVENSGVGLAAAVILIATGALPLAVYLIGALTAPIRARKLAKKVELCEIEFLEDTLVGAYENVKRHYRRYHTRIEVFYVLSFRNCGRYRVPLVQHYAWSDLYSMSPGGIYNTSILGDTFYVAVRKDDPRKTPLWIYNTKLFELAEDGTVRKPRASWKDSVYSE